MGNVILEPAIVLPAVLFAGLAGAILWWLIRKRQTRVWLPTIRIMRLESRILPRLVVRPPEILGFLCFLISALVLIGFALRPRTQIFTPFEPNQTRIHIFADMSASVSAHQTLPAYVARVTALYRSLKEIGRVTVSTSASPEVTEPASAEALAEALTTQGFQRAGLRIGSALKILLEDLGETDRLFVVSDRDQHSWTGFNWQYLLDEMEVAFLDVSAGDTLKNVFVNDARFLSAPNSQAMEWDVELARQTSDEDASGKLTVTYMGRQLGEFPWKIPAGRQRLDVRAEWPQTALEDALKAEGGGDGGDVPLVFRITVEGPDALKADDEFRARLLGLKQDVLLVSETAGERGLEDPLQQLDTALTVLGFKVRRNDYVVQPGPDFDQFPFIVLAGGAGGGVDRFCPKSLEAVRHAARERQGAKSANARAPKVWLMPATLDANYAELCECYSRLLVSKPGETAKPAYCDNVQSRQGYLDLMPSLGAKQIGGEVGDGQTGLAWHGRDAASGLEVLAFSVPLSPSRATGLDHAHLPILVKQLATWNGLLEEKGERTQATWPRVEDLTAKTWRPLAPMEPDEAMRVRQTNVPLGESLLQAAEAKALPPRWTVDAEWSDKQLPAKKDREDPLPWLKLGVGLMLGMALLEGLVLLGMRLGRFVLRRPESTILLLAVLGAGIPDRADAKVEFNLVGYLDQSMTLTTLAREVAHRTSIEVETKPLNFADLSPESMAEPWIWVSDVARVRGDDGRLRPDLALWVKRGGFLVIEAPTPAADLAKLTEGLPPGGDGWLALPPDHEMMRSFYLLDALPACNQEIWRGFHYDGRLAILAIPYTFLASIKDRAAPPACQAPPDQERSVRIFVNLIMVALATDYKKDQIHLPEILKRLR